MKNTFKLLGIIAIVAISGFSMTACSDDDGGSSGGLTITGLGSFNGKYVIAMSSEADDFFIYAMKSINKSNGIMTGGKIDGGSVKLNVYKLLSSGKVNDYKGNDKVQFTLLILNVEKYDDESTSESDYAGYGVVSVTFKDGIASGVVTVIEDEDD
jgi:hypothetical protein